MTEKNQNKKKAEMPVAAEQNATPERVLTCVHEVAAELSMSVKTLYSLLRRYPFCESGASGKLNGRWHVPADAVWCWYRHVQQQEARHPDARRLRPAEPPELQQIKGRCK